MWGWISTEQKIESQYKGGHGSVQNTTLGVKIRVVMCPYRTEDWKSRQA